MKSFSQKYPLCDAILKGVGQIMLQENALTGALFLIGIFYGNIFMGIAAILSTLSGTLVARKLGFPPKNINTGLYGFSPALVGVALTFIFQPTPVIWILVIVMGGVAAIVQHAFIVKNIPVFTFPFVLVTWLVVYVLHTYTSIPPSAEISSPAINTIIDDFSTSTNGFGEVIFQGSVIAGVLFLIAVFVNNPLSALYGLSGSIIGAAISARFEEPSNQVHMGLFSFNAVLAAIAFSGPRKVDGLYVLLAVVISTLVDIFLLSIHSDIFAKAGGVLTFPFVFSCWCTLMVKEEKTGN